MLYALGLFAAVLLFLLVLVVCVSIYEAFVFHKMEQASCSELTRLLRRYHVSARAHHKDVADAGRPHPTFRQQIAYNKRATVILVVVFCMFIAAASMVVVPAACATIVGTIGRSSLGAAAAKGRLSPATIVVGPAVAGSVAAGAAILIAIVAYYLGDVVVLSVSGAKKISHHRDPVLFNVVEEMAIAAGIPMPQVYLIRDQAPNAMATGRDPRHAAVAITTGLREKLSRDELQGIVAHELSHVRNYDTRLMTLLAVLVGAASVLSALFWLVFVSLGRGRRDDDDLEPLEERAGAAVGVIVMLLLFGVMPAVLLGGPVLAAVFALAAILSALGPLFAHIIQLAVSRQREYLADALAVEMTRSPLALASALRKIDDDPYGFQRARRGTAHLFITNPIKGFVRLADTVFASHPRIGDRIRRLEALV
jgi:heat shock protein HtpX